jgi:hypothetical protein
MFFVFGKDINHSDMIFMFLKKITLLVHVVKRLAFENIPFADGLFLGGSFGMAT